MKKNIITTYTEACTKGVFALGVALLLVFTVLPITSNNTAIAYDFGEGYNGVGDAGEVGGGANGGDTFSGITEIGLVNYGLDYSSYDFASGYNGIGDAGDFGGYADIAAFYDYTEYDFAFDYDGIGDAADGCCGDFYDYTEYDFAYNYDGIGDAGEGCCGNDFDYTEYDFAYNYDGIGDAGEGCCGNDSYTIYDFYAYDYYDFGYDGPTDSGNNPDIPVEAPRCTLTASDSNVAAGDVVTLRWTTSNAREVSFDRGIGEVARNGSLRVTVNATRTYTLTAENRNGVDVDCTTTIVVDDTNDNDLVCTLTATPSRVDEGEVVTLRWTTENATRVSINNGVGTVARNGSLRVNVNNDRTYTLTAENRAGEETECTRTITVDDENDNNNDNVRCDAFTARPDSISERERVTLRWSTTGADSVTINNGIGRVSDDGSREITVARDVTFTLTARNGNDIDTCRVEIEFDEDDNSPSSNNLRCELTVSDRSIRAGESVRLSWDNDRTEDIIIRDNFGKTLVDTNRNGSDEDPDRDQITIRPTRTTTFTLTAENGSRERECRVRVEVDGVSLTSVRAQDTILLSQVPYTGFEAGPTLTMIFYVAIVLWGFAVAYALVVKKKPTHKVTTHVVPTVVSNPVVEEVEVPTVTDFVPSNLPTADEGVVTIEAPLHNEAFQALEAHAHAHYALFSSDALRFIASQNDVLEDQMATLDRVIALAKAKYPKEGDWVVINKEKVTSLLS